MLEFIITNQTIKRVDKFIPATDSVNYLTANFTFATDDWGGTGKTALFRVGTTTYEVVINNNQCTVPFEVLVASSESRSGLGVENKFFLTVVGEKGTTIIPTKEIKVKLKTSGYTEGLTPAEPTEDVYSQIITAYGETQETIENLKTNVDEQITKLDYTEPKEVTWRTNGLGASTDGNVSTNTARNCTTDFSPVADDYVAITKGTKVALLFYKEAKGGTSSYLVDAYTDYLTENIKVLDYAPSEANYYKIVVGTINNDNINTPDADGKIYADKNVSVFTVAEDEINEVYNYVDKKLGNLENKLTYSTTKEVTWRTNGLGASTDGNVNTNTTTRCSSYNFLPIADDYIVMTEDTNVGLCFYKEAKGGTSSYLVNDYTNWLTGEVKVLDYAPTEAKYYKILVRKSDDSNINTPDADGKIYADNNVSVFTVAEEETTDEPITSTGDLVVYSILEDVEWQSKGINSSNGSANNYQHQRCRTGHISLKDDLVVAESETTEFMLYFYDVDKKFIQNSGADWLTGKVKVLNYAPENAKYYRLIVKDTSNTNIDWGYGKSNISIYGNHTKLIHDIPENIGVLNAIMNAKQMCRLPYITKAILPNQASDYAANTPIVGLPYSSVKTEGNYVPNAVSFETFMSAVQNPNSYLYTKTENSENSKTYYGAVCSTLVGYCIGLKAIYTTPMWADIEGMELVEDQTAYGLKLGDVLWVSGHVEMVTDIARDYRGRIKTIQIARAITPFCDISTFTLERFDDLYKNQSLQAGSQANNKANYITYRYKHINKAQYTPIPYLAVEDEEVSEITYNLNVMPRRGEKANYRLGEDVEIDINNDSNYTNVLVYKDETLVNTLAISDVVTLTNLAYGSYKVRLTDGTNNSEFAHFIVVDSSISASANSTNKNDAITFSFSSANATPFVIYLCKTSGGVIGLKYLTDEEITNGSVIWNDWEYIKNNNVEYCKFKVAFDTKYGVYSSDFVEVTITG